MMRQNTSKKIQSQELILAKNYVEQELESAGYRGNIKYDNSSKTLIQFRVKEGTIAILKEGKICIFKMPVKKFGESLPLEFDSVEINSIKTQKATCCNRCHTWKQQADITRCVCGGYLVQRKRFSAIPVESWDAEFLEVQLARKDIAKALKTDRTMSRKPKRYNPTGITPKIAGMSSVITETRPRMLTRVSENGAKWLETFGVSPLAEQAVIRKINGFNIPANDENIQASLRTSLMNFSSKVEN